MSKIAELLRNKKVNMSFNLFSTRFWDENFIKLNKGEFFMHSCYINSLSTQRLVVLVLPFLCLARLHIIKSEHVSFIDSIF